MGMTELKTSEMIKVDVTTSLISSGLLSFLSYFGIRSKASETESIVFANDFLVCHPTPPPPLSALRFSGSFCKIWQLNRHNKSLLMIAGGPVH